MANTLPRPTIHAADLAIRAVPGEALVLLLPPPLSCSVLRTPLQRLTDFCVLRSTASMTHKAGPRARVCCMSSAWRCCAVVGLGLYASPAVAGSFAVSTENSAWDLAAATDKLLHRHTTRIIKRASSVHQPSIAARQNELFESRTDPSCMQPAQFCDSEVLPRSLSNSAVRELIDY
jgi:hypothetical protein